jgi:2-epi-5-epi-valiolone 7-kinase
MDAKRSLSVSSARRRSDPVIVLDLGGTWFRAGFMHSDDRVEMLLRERAISIASKPWPVADLQRGLVDFVLESVEHVGRLIEKNHGPATRNVSVAIGAAIDMTTGKVLASAPLWGAEGCGLDLAAILDQSKPEFTWRVVNDVSALAVALLKQPRPAGVAGAAALTVSSGIAYRSIDVRTGKIPYDRTYGLQGEIGHLPTDISWRGRRLDMVCDCGAQSHVSSISSGRALPALLNALPEAARFTDTGESEVRERFGRAVALADPLAIELLDLFTLPVARAVLYQATLNPGIAWTVLNGGVVLGLAPHYLNSLLRNLNTLGLYRISDEDPTYFSRRIVMGNSDGLDVMRGAGIYFRGFQS